MAIKHIGRGLVLYRFEKLGILSRGGCFSETVACFSKAKDRSLGRVPALCGALDAFLKRENARVERESAGERLC